MSFLVLLAYLLLVLDYLHTTLLKRFAGMIICYLYMWYLFSPSFENRLLIFFVSSISNGEIEKH